MMKYFVGYHDLRAELEAAARTKLKGHGGADFFQMNAFVDAVKVRIFRIFIKHIKYFRRIK